jgi:hypothetical protein
MFCGDCRSPLYVQVATRPDIAGVRVCTFDDPSWFRPEANIAVKSAQPWDHLDPAVPQFPINPSGKSYMRPSALISRAAQLLSMPS